LKQKISIKFEEKAIGKTEICKKQAQKTSKFQLKQAQKQATRKSSKKTQFHKKTSPTWRENRKVGNTQFQPLDACWRCTGSGFQDSSPAGFSTF